MEGGGGGGGGGVGLEGRTDRKEENGSCSMASPTPHQNLNRQQPVQRNLSAGPMTHFQILFNPFTSSLDF